MKTDALLKNVCEHFFTIFERERKKDPHFHFGFRNWDDIQLEILEHVYEKLSLFDTNRPLKPWLKQVIKNQIINKKRDYSYQNKIENRQITTDPRFFNWIGDLNNNPPDLSPKQKKNLKRIYQSIQNVWRELKIRDKKIAVLHFKQGISPYLIGFMLNKSGRNVFTRIEQMKGKVLRELKRNEIHTRCLHTFNSKRKRYVVS
jgi:RNA polymerase sigma factor (sigma-70 family)